MGSLFVLPRFTPINGSGRPYSGCKLYIYRASTSTLASVYEDSGLTSYLTNPVVADSNGQLPAIYLDPNTGYNYRVVLKTSSDVELWSEDDVPAGSITSEDVGRSLYPRTTAEIAASATPTAYQYPPGDLRRYGGVGDGSADDTAPWQQAIAQCAAGGEEVYVPPGTWQVGTGVSTGANVTIRGAGFSSVVRTSASITVLTISDTVVIRDLKIKKSGGASTAKAIAWVNCFSSVLENVWIEGFQYGIYGEKTVWTSFKNIRAYNCTYAFYLWAGASPTSWNIDWYNNANTFDNCVADTGTDGFTVYGMGSTFINCTAQDLTGFGFSLQGRSAGDTSKGFTLIEPYCEYCKPFRFRYTRVRISGGFCQGAATLGAAYASIVDAVSSDIVFDDIGLVTHDYFSKDYVLDASNVYNGRPLFALSNTMSNSAKIYPPSSDSEVTAKSVSLPVGSPGTYQTVSYTFSNGKSYRVDVCGVRNGSAAMSASFLVHYYDGTTNSVDKIGGNSVLLAQMSGSSLQLALNYASGNPFVGTAFISQIASITEA